MELLRLSLLLLLLVSCSASRPPPDPLDIPIDGSRGMSAEDSHILYLASMGSIELALDSYIKNYPNLDNYTLLQKLCAIIIDRGYHSHTPEDVLLALYGAGISQNTQLFYILEGCLKSSYPQIQMAALNFLGRSADDRANDEINFGMSSRFLPVRLEAAYWLAIKKSPIATGQLESLMNKLPTMTHSYFPQLFALIGNPSSIKLLKHFILMGPPSLSTQAIIQAARAGIEELLPAIRTISTHLNPFQREACAYALGIFKDAHSLAVLEDYGMDPNPTLRIIAYNSLIHMGKREYLPKLALLAKEENLHAIISLASFPSEAPLLIDLANSTNPQVRLNASLALLKQKNPYCLKEIERILISGIETQVLTLLQSPSKTLIAYENRIPTNTKEQLSIYLALTAQFRERLLVEARELPLDSFYALCEQILYTQQQDLVPTMVHLLENLQTKEALALLKKGKDFPGNPLIRTYCALALFRLDKQRYEEEELLAWLKEESKESIIKFRPMIPWELQSENTPFSLAPEERSQLMIEAFQTLAEKQHPKTIQALINILSHGNPSNRFALAGLLIRATE